MLGVKLNRPRVPIKQRIGIGTEFTENGNLQSVTRVTDLVFDTIDKVTGQVKVRSLGLFDNSRFMNEISGLTNLLKAN